MGEFTQKRLLILCVCSYHCHNCHFYKVAICKLKKKQRQPSEDEVCEYLSDSLICAEIAQFTCTIILCAC